MTTDTTRHRIQLTLLDGNGDPLVGLRTRVTKLRGSSPLAYSLTETGLLFRDVDYLTQSGGTIDVWVTDSEGANIKVFSADNTLAYDKDITVAYIAPGVDLSDAGPLVATALILKSDTPFVIGEGNSLSIDAVLVYSDGTTTDATADLEATSSNASIATFLGGTINAVAPGSATLTFSTTDLPDLEAELPVTVEPFVPATASYFGAIGDVITLVEGASRTIDFVLVLNDGTVYGGGVYPGFGSVSGVSDNLPVATVTGRNVVAVSVGTANVTFTLGALDYVSVVNVVEAP